MRNLMSRANVALAGETGGPSVETIIGIAVALLVGSALILFGGKLVEWISGAGDKVTAINSDISNLQATVA